MQQRNMHIAQARYNAEKDKVEEWGIAKDLTYDEAVAWVQNSKDPLYVHCPMSIDTAFPVHIPNEAYKKEYRKIKNKYS